jgi:uncharacterized protein
MAKIESPCVKICTLDVRSELCLGCGRTIHEIGHWTLMDDEQRRRVMAELPTRLATNRRVETAKVSG